MTSFRRDVRGIGPLDAKIVFVGEAPGKDEIRHSMPFVGKIGTMFMMRLKEAGIIREEVRLENVVEDALPGSTKEKTIIKIDVMYVDGAKKRSPSKELQAWFQDVKARLDGLNPNLIVPTGETALQAICGKSGITKWQGSILEAHNGTKAVPILHPGFIARSYDYMPDFMFTLQKVKEEGTFSELNLPQYKFHLEPSIREIQEFIHRAISTDTIAVDVEAFQNGEELACIGIAINDVEAMCIPLSIPGGSYWSIEDEMVVWQLISKVLKSPNKKLMQNFIYDSLQFSAHGLVVNNMHWDTMTAQAILYPELKKALEFLAMLFSRQAYWKDDRKTWGTKTDPTTLWRYNCIDCCVLFPIYEGQKYELKSTGLDKFHAQRTQHMMGPVHKMCATGMKIDFDRLADHCKDAAKEVKTLETELFTSLGRTYNLRAHLQVKELIRYKGHKVPVKRGTGRETSEIKALLQLTVKQADPDLLLVIKLKKLYKLQDSYLAANIDIDGRMRYSYNIGGTKPGRFSSSLSPWGGGCNIQTVPEKIRDIFIAGQGNVFVLLDNVAAESWVVMALSQDEEMEAVLRTGDIHRRTADEIAGKNTSEGAIAITSLWRALGKMTNHAANYGMRQNTLAENILEKMDLVRHPDECARYLMAYHRAYPMVKYWHRQVEHQIDTTRILRNAFGRERVFYGRRKDHKTYLDAYSWEPASTASDVNKTILLNVWDRCDYAILIQEGHDSLLYELEEKRVGEFIPLLHECSHVPFVIKDKEINIPTKITMGYDWLNLKEIEA